MLTGRCDRRAVVIALAVGITLAAGKGVVGNDSRKREPTPYKIMLAQEKALKADGKLAAVGIGDTETISLCRAITDLVCLIGNEQIQKETKDSRAALADVGKTIIQHASERYVSGLNTFMQVETASASDFPGVPAWRFEDVGLTINDFRIYASIRLADEPDSIGFIMVRSLKLSTESGNVAIFLDACHESDDGIGSERSHFAFWDRSRTEKNAGADPTAEGHQMVANHEALRKLLAEHGFIIRMKFMDQKADGKENHYHLVELDGEKRKIIDKFQRRGESQIMRELDEELKKFERNDATRTPTAAGEPTR